jgi:hypothetical protein
MALKIDLFNKFKSLRPVSFWRKWQFKLEKRIDFEIGSNWFNNTFIHCKAICF